MKRNYAFGTWTSVDRHFLMDAAAARCGDGEVRDVTFVHDIGIGASCRARVEYEGQVVKGNVHIVRTPDGLQQYAMFSEWFTGEGRIIPDVGATAAVLAEAISTTWRARGLFTISKSRVRARRFLEYPTSEILLEYWRLAQRKTWFTRTRFVRRINHALVADKVAFCAHCDEPDLGNRLYNVEDGNTQVCHQCFNRHYFGCSHCGNYFHKKQKFDENHRLCRACGEQHYALCPAHGLYRRELECRACREDCMCISPFLEFTFPVFGRPVAQDEMFSVRLTGEEIPAEGVKEIIDLIIHQGGPHAAVGLLDSWAWLTSEGKLTKRLERAMYNYTRGWGGGGFRAPESLLNGIAQIAAKYKASDQTYRLTFSRDLNQHKARWGNYNSCFWNYGHLHNRCAIKLSGGVGMRAWNNAGDVIGRVFLFPLDREHKVIPDCHAATAFFVFNDYGVLGGSAGARIIAQITGLEFQRPANPVTVDNRFEVNVGSGWLVGSKDFLASPAAASLRLSVSLDHSHVDRLRFAAA